MFKELAALAIELEEEGKLPPAGYYDYREPIRWIARISPGEIYLEAAEQDLPRPFDGRTSAIRAHPIADEAAYALGTSQTKTGSDRRAADKHKAYCDLLETLSASDHLSDPGLREALQWVRTALADGFATEDPRYEDVLSKDWVSFVPDQGPLAGQHLFQHPNTQAFWIHELEARSVAGEPEAPVLGECAVCGATTALTGKIPKVKLASTVPLHGLNADAFVSHIAGSGAFEKAHLGLCFPCAERASRAFNYLRDSGEERSSGPGTRTPGRHYRKLVSDPRKRDSLSNQYAFFWLKQQTEPLVVGSVELDPDAILAHLGEVISETQPTSGTVQHAELSQLAKLLEAPWHPKDHALNIGQFGFYLAVLSPNIGRIALRDWFDVSIQDLHTNLSRFLEASRIVSSWGDDARPYSIATMVQATGTQNPNLTRSLLRTAFKGYLPPQILLDLAVRRLRIPATLQDPKQRWRNQALAAAIKMCLFYETKEVPRMERLDKGNASKPYLCGRLLAIFEKAQQLALGRNLNTTLVDRYYGTASTTPGYIFGILHRQARTAYLPKLRKESRWGRDLIERLLEEVNELLGLPNELPATFTSRQQAEFALGFYQQRADFRSRAKKAMEDSTKKEGASQ